MQQLRTFLTAAVLALAACGGSKPATDTPITAAPTEIRLPYAQAVVGTKYDVVDAMETNLHITTQGQVLDMVQGKSERSSWEILAVEGEAATKIRVRYDELVERQGMGADVKAEPSPVSGHTYVITAEGGKLTITRDDGAVSEEEIAALTRMHDDLGQPVAMSKMIAGKTFTIGTKVDLDAADLAMLAEDAARTGSPAPRSGSFTLTSIDGGVAHLTMAMVVAKEDPTQKLEMSITGQVTIDTRTGQMLEMVMEGPLSGSGQATIEGTMKGRKVTTFK